jgi:flagellin
MAIVSRSNQAALYALRGLNGATDLLTRTTRRLSTGLRIESASDDPAGFVFAQNLRTRLKSLESINQYNQSSRSLVQTAEDGLATIIDHLQTIRTLAVDSTNGTLTTADREANQTQVASLRAEITSIANNTFFNAKSLLSGDFASGTATIRFQVGVDSGNIITLNIRTITAAALGIASIDVSTQAGANTALDLVDSAINLSNDESASLGAVDNRLESSGLFLSNQIENHENALGGVEDADLARETVQFALAQVLRQTSASALAQANIYPQNVLSVILPGA